MSILQRLGLVKPATPAEREATVPEILAIADRLEGLDPYRAQYIALFAIVLARAARADLEISNDERTAIEGILRDHGELPDDQAALVGEMVALRRQVFGVSTDYLATREFADSASIEDRESILRCLFAVCAADDSISLVEEEEVRQIASELGLSHEQFTAARSVYRDKREVLRGLKGGGGGRG
jgi:uncharacterized tellurite resistance protein B-like protein